MAIKINSFKHLLFQPLQIPLYPSFSRSGSHADLALEHFRLFLAMFIRSNIALCAQGYSSGRWARSSQTKAATSTSDCHKTSQCAQHTRNRGRRIHNQNQKWEVLF